MFHIYLQTGCVCILRHPSAPAKQQLIRYWIKVFTSHRIFDAMCSCENEDFVVIKYSFYYGITSSSTCADSFAWDDAIEM